MVTFRNNNNARKNNFKRKVPGRNNHNAPKLIEKYNDLAREASSNGDKILSENYLQHADHFTRILNEQENYKRLKFAENKSAENKSAENTAETQELSEKTEEIIAKDKKVVAEIKPISKKKTEYIYFILIIFSDFRTSNFILLVSKSSLFFPFKTLPDGSFSF